MYFKRKKGLGKKTPIVSTSRAGTSLSKSFSAGELAKFFVAEHTSIIFHLNIYILYFKNLLSYYLILK